MSTDAVISEQFINCTDESTRRIECVLTQKKSLPPQTRGLRRSAHPPRFPHRTLPPLRKTRVQMLSGPWSWPQVLPVCQLSQSETPAGLCPPAVAQPRRAITRQLTDTENPPRKYLRHQSRAPSKKRGALTGGWLDPHRCWSSCNLTRQYAAKSLNHGQRLRDRFTGGRR